MPDPDDQSSSSTPPSTQRPWRTKRCPYATWAVISGILGFILVLPAVAAVILGHMALRQIERSEGRLHGVRWAAGSLAMGYAVLLIVATMLVITVADRVTPDGLPTKPHTTGETVSTGGLTTNDQAVAPTNEGAETFELKLPTTGPAIVPAPQWNETNLVVCVRELEAFDPKKPSKSIGRFQVNTPLLIGDKDRTSGMYHVTFKPSQGPEIHGLCNAAELGR